MRLEKISDLARRHYDDACGAALALDIVGERWSILVIRELLLGPRRFGELRKGLAGISANVLTQRLEGLEASGVVRRHQLPPPASVQVYALTDWGMESEPILLGLCRWALRSPRHDPALPFSSVAMMLSLKALLRPDLAGDLSATIAFALEEDRFTARLASGVLDVRRGEPGGADVGFASSARGLMGLFYGGRPLEEAEGDGSVRITGDRSLAKRLARLFPLPDKVSG